MIESIPFHSEREREKKKERKAWQSPSHWLFILSPRSNRAKDPRDGSVDEKNYSGQLTWKAFRIWRTYTMQSGTWELFTLDLVVSK